MAKRRPKGDGSVYFWEKKNLWVGKVTLPDGKRKTKYGKTKTEVREWIFETKKSLTNGSFIAKDKITVGEFLTQYLEDVAKEQLRPSTFKSYSNIIRWHILPEIGNIRLTQLRPDHLHSLYRKKKESGLSDRTVQYIHGVLHRTLEKAVKWGLITHNVTDLAEAPTNPRKEMKTWDENQVKQFLSVIEDDRWKAIYYVACLGLREGEILGLSWKNVSLEDSYLKVVQTLQFVQGMGLVFSEPKSKKSRRQVTLPEFVVGALREHREKQNLLRKSENWHEEGLVFTTNLGTPISPRNLIRHFKTKLKEAGLPEIRFHDLRHTAASLLLAKNVHPKIVQELLGHSSITLTLDTYSHIIPTLQKEAADKLDSIFKK